MSNDTPPYPIHAPRSSLVGIGLRTVQVRLDSLLDAFPAQTLMGELLRIAIASNHDAVDVVAREMVKVEKIPKWTRESIDAAFPTGIVADLHARLKQHDDFLESMDCKCISDIEEMMETLTRETKEARKEAKDAEDALEVEVKKRDDALTENATLSRDLEKLDRELDEYKRANDDLEKRLGATETDNDNLVGEVGELQMEVVRLKAALNIKQILKEEQE